MQNVSYSFNLCLRCAKMMTFLNFPYLYFIISKTSGVHVSRNHWIHPTVTMAMTMSKTTSAMTTRTRALCFSSSMDEVSILQKSESASLDILFLTFQDRIMSPYWRFKGSKNLHVIWTWEQYNAWQWQEPNAQWWCVTSKKTEKYLNKNKKKN